MMTTADARRSFDLTNVSQRVAPLAWGLMLALGLAVRCRQYFFNASYWYDEAYLILTIRQHSYAELLGALPYQLTAPPLFLWLTRALHDWGGDGEMLMRLPAFLAGIGALFLMIPLARRVLGMPHAFWPCALLALGLHAVTHGSDVRSYTIDVLVAELILLCTVVLCESEPPRPAKRWALVGLGGAALLGPWVSFPALFLLAAASVCLAWQAWAQPRTRPWMEWMLFNLAVGISTGLLWWLVARHRYYPGLLEHWQKGWDGFPQWQSALDIARWLVTRPYAIGNYANRDMGVLLSLLAVVGGGALIRKKLWLAALLISPFVFAVVAALLGKYPLAHRTTLFLGPPLYLLAGAGVAWLAEWRILRGRLAWIGVFVVLWSAAHMVRRTIHPDPGLDYRGAYAFIHAHRAPGDAIWSQMAVVYQTYYGIEAPVLSDHEFDRAEEAVRRGRLWMVGGANRGDFQARLEAAGGRVVQRHEVSGLRVLLFEPANLH